MKFRYSKFPKPPTKAHPSLKWFRRPIIRIELINNNQKISILAMIDSGADWCMFQGSIGQQIGLNIEEGDFEKIVGIRNVPIKVYFHNIMLKIGGWEKSCFAGFSFDLA